MVAKLQVQMKDAMQRIDRITPGIQITCSTERINNCLPLKSINDIKDMESRFQDNNFLQEYVSKKSIISFKDVIRHCYYVV